MAGVYGFRMYTVEGLQGWELSVGAGAPVFPLLTEVLQGCGCGFGAWCLSLVLMLRGEGFPSRGLVVWVSGLGVWSAGFGGWGLGFGV